MTKPMIAQGGDFARSVEASRKIHKLLPPEIPGAGYAPLEGAVETHGTQITGSAGRPANSHDWIKSTLGHGETMCSRCFVTNREAAVLGELDLCPATPNQGAET